MRIKIVAIICIVTIISFVELATAGDEQPIVVTAFDGSLYQLCADGKPYAQGMTIYLFADGELKGRTTIEKVENLATECCEKLAFLSKINVPNGQYLGFLKKSQAKMFKNSLTRDMQKGYFQKLDSLVKTSKKYKKYMKLEKKLIFKTNNTNYGVTYGEWQSKDYMMHGEIFLADLSGEGNILFVDSFSGDVTAFGSVEDFELLDSNGDGIPEIAAILSGHCISGLKTIVIPKKKSNDKHKEFGACCCNCMNQNGKTFFAWTSHCVNFPQGIIACSCSNHGEGECNKLDGFREDAKW
jgi:hypothetical protein